MSEAPQVLYHFTSPLYAPMIRQQGIRRGDITVSLETGFCAPCLTADSSWDKQSWTQNSTPGFNKAQTRFRVEIPSSERHRLRWWKDLLRGHGASEEWIQNQATEGHEHWWVFLGVIPPEWLTEVKGSPGHPAWDWSILGATSNLRTLSYRGKPGEPRVGRVRFKSTNIRDALARIGHWPLPDRLVRGGNPLPWSNMPKGLLRVLIDASGPEERVTEGLRWVTRNLQAHAWKPDYLDTIPCFMVGVGRWLRGSQKVIEITPAAANTLLEIAPRFSDLPPPSKENNLAFLWDGLVYGVCPTVEENGERGVSVYVWEKKDGCWEAYAPAEDPDRVWVGPLKWNALDQLLGTPSPLKEVFQVLVNALAAMNEKPKIVVGKRKPPRKRRHRRAPQTPGKSLILDESGLCLVTKRWALLDAEVEAEKRRLEQERKKPCLHTVEPHNYRVWVNKPLPHEKAIETREKVSSKGVRYTQFRVWRKRGKTGPDGKKIAFSRGSDVKEKKSRLKRGPADL